MQKALIPAWPREIPRVFKQAARLKHGLDGYRYLDAIALGHARRLRMEQEQNSGLTGTWTELIYSNRVDFTAMTANATETSLLGGTAPQQPVIPALFFDGTRGFGRAVTLLMRGVLTTTSGPPTLNFKIYLNTTLGVTNFGGTLIGTTNAITMAASVTNKYWELRLDMICFQPGQGTTNTILTVAGYAVSPAGFGTTAIYPIEPTNPDTATWTATIDSSVTQYINVSGNWSSASNSITCKQLLVAGLN